MAERVSRKDFLRGGLRGLLRGMRSQDTSAAPEPPSALRRPLFLRPPGAIAEELFVQTCERCSRCVEACHQDSIVALPAAWGETLEGSPAIFPEARACFLCTDVPCATACPSGALRPLPVHAIRLGVARIDLDTCLMAAGEPCDACVMACPWPGEVIAISGPGGVPVVEEALCTGCGLCVGACPTRPWSVRIEPAHQRK